MEQIKRSIKNEIQTRLVGNYLPDPYIKRKLIKIKNWWGPGFQFHPEFELAKIPVSGPVYSGAN